MHEQQQTHMKKDSRSIQMGELLTKKSLKEVHWEPDKRETQYNIQTPVNYRHDGCFILHCECLGFAEQLSIMDPVKECP